MFLSFLSFLASRLGGWAVGGLAVLIVGGLLMIAKARIDVLEAEAVLQLKNIATLETSIADQQNAIELTKMLSEANIKRIANYEAAQADSRAETQRMIGVINDLRSNEEQRALQEPYERGLASGARLNSIMQRFSTNPNIQDGDNTNVTTADNP